MWQLQNLKGLLLIILDIDLHHAAVGYGLSTDLLIIKKLEEMIPWQPFYTRQGCIQLHRFSGKTNPT
ncbi:hypothetical protein D770_26315 [Flammeovirgaceae bacterium 311]|nr:hypothetical protein D770_26315 [Flammeovirgaceae bacterium 311]